MTITVYNLECEYSHRFEGWFRSSEDFDTQRQQQLLSCPECGTCAIRKVPSKISTGQNETGDRMPTTLFPRSALTSTLLCASHNPNSVGVTTAFVMAKQAIQALINHSEDVGERFAEEARKIHYDEAPIRAIRGHASAKEFEALRDEGIEIIALPPFANDEELN